MRSITSYTGWVILGLSGAAGIVAQEEGAPAFQESIEVHELRLEVRVDNGLGLPVDSLTADDFVVTEDGEPVEIVDFRILQDGKPFLPLAEEAGASPEQIEAALAEPEVAVQREPELVVILTDFQMRRPRFVTAMARLLQWVDEHPEEIAERNWMVGFVDRSVGFLGEPTNDPVELKATLENLSSRKIEGRIWRFVESPSTEPWVQETRTYNARESGRTTGTDETQRQRMMDRQGCSGKRTWMLGQVDSLRRLVESLAPLPGRKTVVWMHSFSLYRLTEGCSRGDMFTVVRAVGDLGALASSAGVVFHASSMGGLIPVDSYELTEQNMAVVSPSTFETTFSLGALAQSLAQYTGGQKVGLNDPSWIFHRAFKDSVYELTVLVPHGRDGRRHDIKVRIKEGYPLAILRYPRTYVDLSKRQLLMNQLQRFSMLPGSYGSFPVYLKTEEARNEELEAGESVDLAVSVAVPVGRVGMLTQEDGGQLARLEPYVSVHNLDGELVEFQQLDSSEFRLAKGVEIAPEDVLQATTRIPLPPGEYLVNGAFYDALNDTSGVTSARVNLTQSSN